jgi:hypothetical protein
MNTFITNLQPIEPILRFVGRHDIALLCILAEIFGVVILVVVLWRHFRVARFRRPSGLKPYQPDSNGEDQ